MQGYQLEKKPNICRDLDGGAVGIFLADMTQQIQFYTLDLGGTVDLQKTHTRAHRYLLFCIDMRTRKHTLNLILNSFNEDNVFPPVCCVL